MEPPRTIGGYRVERLLGRGGFGDVYAAQPAGGGAELAIKLMHAELCQTPEAIARFRREAELTARLDHPNIVSVRELGALDDGRPFLVMERLDGVDLESALATRGKLAFDEALAILEPIASALAAAHAAGVIHRDVKPSNVFLASDPPRVVLLDFGVAKLLDPAAGSLTGSLVAIGTPTCMAPEQIAGGEITGRTDVYGLASLAFHVLTGEPPFRDPSPTVLQQLHLHARRPRPSSRAGLPVAIDAPIVRGMDRDPKRRQAGPVELVAELRAAVRAVATPAPVGEVVAAAVRVAPADGAAIDDTNADALETTLDALVAILADAGLTVIAECGDLVVLVADRADVAALAAEVDDRIAAAPATVIAQVAFHRGTAVDTLTWLPDEVTAGVWRSPALRDQSSDGPGSSEGQ